MHTTKCGECTIIIPSNFRNWPQNMIELTKMDSRRMLLNEDAIESVEETPDTVVRLLNGNKYIVKESRKEILDKITAFKRLKAEA